MKNNVVFIFTHYCFGRLETIRNYLTSELKSLFDLLLNRII